MAAEIIAYHGWGYDGSVWEPWRPWLAQQGYNLYLFDRGYFGSPLQPRFSQEATAKILLVHSYGLHLSQKNLSQEHLGQDGQAADMLIIFAGFQSFHPPTDRLQKRSQQMVQQMIHQFSASPQQVLQNFRAKCCHPCPWDVTLPESLKVDMLLQDLNDLNHANLDLAPLAAVPQIVVLQGQLDRIVAPARGQELAQNLAVPYFELEAGHSLSFTHLEACQSILSPFLAMGATL